MLRHSPIHDQPFKRMNAHFVSFEFRLNFVRIVFKSTAVNSHRFESALQMFYYDFIRLELTS